MGRMLRGSIGKILTADGRGPGVPHMRKRYAMARRAHRLPSGGRRTKGTTNGRRNRLATVLTLALLLGTAFIVVSHEVDGSPYASVTPPRGVEVVATALMEASEAPLSGVSVLGDYAFVGGQSSGYSGTEAHGIRVVDLSIPEQPQLVSRIPLRAAETTHSHGDAIAAHIASPSFDGDIAVVLNGVPDMFSPENYPQPYGIWDVTDPTNPQFLSILDIGYQSWGRDGGSLTDKPYDSKAIVKTHLYAIYDAAPPSARIRDAHLAVVDLSDPTNPTVVGDWQDAPQVMLLGLTLNEAGTRAYVTGIWPARHPHLDGFVYILDIQDPSDPTEIGRFVFPLRGDPSSVSKAVPNADDTLLIVADHSWKPGKCGILTILDISDLSTIHEISTFALPESDAFQGCAVIATDLVVEGNLIYSTWGNGGMRVVDFSDPRRPIQVAEFRGPGSSDPDWWLSDVVVMGDIVVATRVWAEGLYIFRLTDEVPTVIIDEARSLRISTNTASTQAGYHVSWEWPDGTRESAWDGFVNFGRGDDEIGDDGWVYLQVCQCGPTMSAEKMDLEVTGVYTWGVTEYVMETDPANVIFDRVQVFLTAPERVNLESAISWSAFYEYDGQAFLGDVTIVGESDRVGKFVHSVQAISDPLYGIETFAANEVEVIFDRITVTLEVETPTIPVGETAEILIQARYTYDGSPFQGVVGLSKELIQAEAGTYSYTVASIEDSAYGLTEFSSNTVDVTFYVLPFYTQQSFLMLLFALVAAVGVAVFLWRRKPWRPKGAKARVDDIRW